MVKYSNNRKVNLRNNRINYVKGRKRNIINYNNNNKRNFGKKEIIKYYILDLDIFFNIYCNCYFVFLIRDFYIFFIFF